MGMIWSCPYKPLALFFLCFFVFLKVLHMGYFGVSLLNLDVIQNKPPMRSWVSLFIGLLVGKQQIQYQHLHTAFFSKLVVTLWTACGTFALFWRFDSFSGHSWWIDSWKQKKKKKVCLFESGVSFSVQLTTKSTFVFSKGSECHPLLHHQQVRDKNKKNEKEKQGKKEVCWIQEHCDQGFAIQFWLVWFDVTVLPTLANPSICIQQWWFLFLFKDC